MKAQLDAATNFGLCVCGHEQMYHAANTGPCQRCVGGEGACQRFEGRPYKLRGVPPYGVIAEGSAERGAVEVQLNRLTAGLVGLIRALVREELEQARNPGRKHQGSPLPPSGTLDRLGDPAIANFVADAIRNPKPAAPAPAVEGLPKMDRCIVEALKARSGKTTRLGQVALFTGYRVSGNFSRAIARLRAAGHIGGTGNRLVVTSSGAALVPDVIAKTGAELFREWSRKVKEMERKILAALHAANWLELDELADHTSYAISGNFSRAIARLVALELIVRTKPKTYCIAPELR
jgi:hypothetical protein